MGWHCALYPTANDIRIYQVMWRRFCTCGGNFYRALDSGHTTMVDIFKKPRLWYLTIWCLFIQIDALYPHCAICMSNNDGVADCTGTRKPCVLVFTLSAVIRTVFVQSCTQKIYPQEFESLTRRFGTPCYGKFIHYFNLQRGIEPRWRLSPSVDLLSRPHLEIDWLTCKKNSGDYAYIFKKKTKKKTLIIDIVIFLFWKLKHCTSCLNFFR